MDRILRAGRPASRTRGVAVAVLAPAVATLLSLPVRDHGAVIPTLLYLLAVVVAAALGRFWSGLAAAVLSFLGLNFFVTPPLHTLRVEKAEDVAALVVFLAVSLIVGALLARALEERARAQRSEEEATMLNTLALRLRSGESLDKVLTDFAKTMLDHFALARCDVRADDGGGIVLDVSVPAGAPEPGDGAPSLDVPLESNGREFGAITVARSGAEPSFSREERRVLAGIAVQTALAMERARLDGEVHRTRLEAEANMARAALFSSVTHDLRTPLASIKAGVSSLLQPDVVYDEAEQRDLLQTVLEETDRLNRLVGNLLDLSRVRAGALTPSKTKVPLEEVIEAVLARMRPQLKERSVRTVIRPDLPEIPIDPVQIDQVMTNILENAVHFSPPDSEILVSVAPWRSVLQVRVADQGPGIPPEERERVFEAFYSGEGPGSGTGLGLAIARAIVESHGGSIRVEGSPSGGAAVVFELPTEGEGS